MSEWFNSFILEPKANCKLWFYKDPASLNRVLFRPVQRGPILYNIPSRLAGIKYLSFFETISGYHNHKLDEQSLSCFFGRYRYTHLLFAVMPAGDMFQRMYDKIFQEYARYLVLLMTL